MGTMMAFEAMTKIVDATGRVDPPEQTFVSFMANVVVKVNAKVEAIKKSLPSTRLALGLSFGGIAVGIAYGIYSKTMMLTYE